MNRSEIKDLIRAILHQVDYDMAKSYDPLMVEEPEYAEEQMENLITFTEKFLKKLEKKSAKKK